MLFKKKTQHIPRDGALWAELREQDELKTKTSEHLNNNMRLPVT